MMKKLAIALAAALFLTLAGTGAGYALWSSRASVGSTVSAGTVVVTSTDSFASLSGPYTTTSPTNAAPITVSNTGTIPAPYTLSLAAQSATTLATGVAVRTWPVASTAPATCSTTVAIPTSATSSNWTNVPVLTGTLAAGASAFYCVRTSITSAQVTSLAGTSVMATQTLISAVGRWTSTATASKATQSVAADTTPPSQPATPTSSGTTDTMTTISWTAATDNVGVVRYDVYRNDVRVGTTTGTSYTDVGLASKTTYAYTVFAFDAAGNQSAQSVAASVRTLNAAWYRITNVNNSLCVDGSGAGQSDGTALIVWGCIAGSTNQAWQLVATSNGYVKIIARYAPALAWDIAADQVKAQLFTYSGATDQQWKQVPDGAGRFTFRNLSSDKCLDVPNASTTAGTQLQQFTCNSTPAQSFTMTVVP